MRQQFRVVTADIAVWAETPPQAIEIARRDMGARVHARPHGPE